MNISIFELFSIGIGPSSSHTVGPMRAARRFLLAATQHIALTQIDHLVVELYGSLALTGKGHGTDKAILMGLTGETPESVEPSTIPERLATIRSEQKLALLGQHPIRFHEIEHLQFFYKKVLPHHANGMRFTAYAADNTVLFTQDYYSVGGGFIVTAEECQQDKLPQPAHTVPYSFHSAAELLEHCQREHKTIAEIMLANEKTWRTEAEITERVALIWQVMQHCIDAGSQHAGELPGGLKVKRRAPKIYASLQQAGAAQDPMNWLNFFALAVNEENAAGGRVVTAPTNGAAGIIPAVFAYYLKFTPHAKTTDALTYFLTAGAVGLLYKENASISAAEVGCQGEVGVACSMAAAGICALWGGTVEQIENAAEIGMEHHLGLTCDPIAGLVQIPCIERNTMGSLQAINSAKLALLGDGSHLVSLDAVIRTMRATGHDMQSKYKETALGGLAVHQTAC